MMSNPALQRTRLKRRGCRVAELARYASYPLRSTRLAIVVLPVAILSWLLVGCAARWSRPEPEPAELQSLRPKLALLKEGMEQRAVFSLLGLDVAEMSHSGCLHEDIYSRIWDRDYMLSIEFDTDGTNEPTLRGVRVVTFKRREEIWPK